MYYFDHSNIQGKLVIKTTSVSDSGNYTCVPSYVIQDWVMVHVLTGMNILLYFYFIYSMSLSYIFLDSLARLSQIIIIFYRLFSILEYAFEEYHSSNRFLVAQQLKKYLCLSVRLSVPDFEF